jgi:hypothetical protein
MTSASGNRYICLDEIPGQPLPWWEKAFFVLCVETGECWGVGEKRAWKIPRPVFLEWRWTEIEEVSLVDVPACRFAVVALAK